MYLTIYEDGKFTTVNEEERKLKGFRDQLEGEDFYEYLADLGFETDPIVSRGSEFGRLFQVYQSKQGCYMAYVEFASMITEILILGIGSFLEFLKQYEPIFLMKDCDYFEISSNNWIRKSAIKELKIHSSYKKDEIVELTGWDETNEPVTLLKNSRDYILTRLKEDFGIEY